MKLAIVAYPSLDEAHRQWIEAVRRIHDPQAARIAVHFTLVFPLDGLADDLQSEMEAVARASQPIQFAIGHAAAVPDRFSRAVHVFLVPEDGGAEIAGLHDLLYAGRLRGHLRSDIPYVPHLTVGATEDSAVAERLASELQDRARSVRGVIAGLHLVNLGERQVRSVTTYRLGGAAGRLH